MPEAVRTSGLAVFREQRIAGGDAGVFPGKAGGCFPGGGPGGFTGAPQVDF